MRTELAEALVKLADDVPAARAALGLSRQAGRARSRATPRSGPAPRCPPSQRYTGVLYDALDVALADPGPAGTGRTGGSPSARRCSAWCAPTTAIPAYRLSAGSALPGLPTLRALWKPALAPVLAARRRPRRRPAQRLLRRASAPVPGAVHRGGARASGRTARRSVVSHFNKAHKGRLARLLATTTAEPDSVGATEESAEACGVARGT